MLVVIILLGWWSLSIQAASFDCAKAGSKVEHIICDNPDISKLDDELAQRYKVELQYWATAYETKQEQKLWIKERNSCLDKECVKRAYETRLNVFAANQSAPPTPAGKIGKRAKFVIYGKGHGQMFCEAILAALNKRKPSDDYLPCISEELLKLPGVSDPPWEKLDLSQHEELAKKVTTVGTVGSPEYFRENKLDPSQYPTPEQQQRGLERAKQLGAELYSLKLAPDLFGDRVLVTLKHRSDMCGRPIDRSVVRGEEVHAAWVMPDLKEIAKFGGYLPSTAARPLLYWGRLYFVQPYGDMSLEVLVPGRETLTSACDIRLSIK